MNRYPLSLAVVAAASIAGMTSVQAAEPDDVEAALRAQFESSDLTLSLDGSSADGDDIVLTGMSVTAEGKTVAELEELRLQDVSDARGGYMIERIEIEPRTLIGSNGTLQFGGMTLENFYLPEVDAADALYPGTHFESLQAGPISIGSIEGEIARIGGVNVTASPLTDGPPYTSRFEAADIAVDFEMTGDPALTALMDSLGYAQLTGSMSADGQWNTQSGNLTVEPLRIDVEEAGSLLMSLNVEGLTEEIASRLGEMSEQRATPQPGRSEEDVMMQTLGVLQDVDLRMLSLSFTDASLTERLLTYYAERQGTTADNLSNQIQAIAPAFAAQLNDPDLARQASAAIRSFFTERGTLTVTAAPEGGLPFGQLLAISSTAPQTIPSLLGLSITADTGGAEGGTNGASTPDGN